MISLYLCKTLSDILINKREGRALALCWSRKHGPHTGLSSGHYPVGGRFQWHVWHALTPWRPWQISLLKRREESFTIFRINSVEYISRKRDSWVKVCFPNVICKFFSMLPFGLCNYLFGSCIIFHHSCTENFDHSFEFPNVHDYEQCWGEIFVYIV